MSENRANMMQFEVDPANPPKLSKAAMRRLVQIQDRAIDYSDIPPLSDKWFEQAEKRAHVSVKRPISLRLDQDIIDYFRKPEACLAVIHGSLQELRAFARILCVDLYNAQMICLSSYCFCFCSLQFRSILIFSARRQKYLERFPVFFF